MSEAKRAFRRKHPLDVLSSWVLIVAGVGLLYGMGYLSAGYLEEGELLEIGGVWHEDGTWSVHVGDMYPDMDYGVFGARREYLECRYNRLGGEVVRRFWIGKEIETTRELSRLEELEFGRYLQDWFGEGFPIYDRQAYEQEAAGKLGELLTACPQTVGGEVELVRGAIGMPR